MSCEKNIIWNLFYILYLSFPWKTMQYKYHVFFHLTFSGLYNHHHCWILFVKWCKTIIISYLSYLSHMTLSRLCNCHHNWILFEKQVLYHIFLTWHFPDYIITIIIEFTLKNSIKIMYIHIYFIKWPKMVSLIMK